MKMNGSDKEKLIDIVIRQAECNGINVSRNQVLDILDNNVLKEKMRPNDMYEIMCISQTFKYLFDDDEQILRRLKVNKKNTEIRGNKNEL